MHENPNGRGRRHALPTHLSYADAIEFSILGIPIRVSLRQGAILLVGWSLCFDLWRRLDGIEFFFWGGFVRLALPAFLALLLLAFVTIRIAGRPLEMWGTLALRYVLLRPRMLVWRRLSISAPIRRSA